MNTKTHPCHMKLQAVLMKKCNERSQTKQKDNVPLSTQTLYQQVYHLYEKRHYIHSDIQSAMYPISKEIDDEIPKLHPVVDLPSDTNP